jgi:thymidine kinase
MPTTHHKAKSGILEVICGPMFSGKSEELIRRLRRAKIAKQEVAVFKHAFDNRHNTADIRSRNGNTLPGFATSEVENILKLAQENHIQVVGIDEIQFFSTDVIPVICDLVAAGKQVIVSGLDLDFRGVPFGPMPTLLAIADTITKLQAICTECGLEAHFTQRLVNNQPAKFDGPIVQVGAQETYQARCRGCYKIDRMPEFRQII